MLSKALAPILVASAFAQGPSASGDARRRAVICADFYAGRYGVPRELVHAIIEVESGWQSDVISSKGAAGLMQLMPATAVAFGVRNRFRMEENVRAGVAYLAWLQGRFQGDLRLVTAAYFAGENAIAPSGLNDCSPEVYHYVSHVARIYRRKRMEAMKGSP